MQQCKSLLPLILSVLLSTNAWAEPENHHSRRELAARAHVPKVAHRRSLAARHRSLQPQLPSARPQGRQLRVWSTAYCLRGHTASGSYVSYGTVAVDPRVIPLGTRMYIPGYGYAVARDTGGAIVGNKIDVWFPSLGQCYQWGYRPVTITILDTPRRRRR